MGELTLQMRDDLPLRDVVYETLRHAIFSGDLRPGERLQEIALSERLGVSRTPVREALHMLQKEGLVKVTPHRGATVARMTVEDMEHVLEVRENLDEFAVRLAAERIGEEELTALDEASAAFAQSTKGDDVWAIASADVKFHDIIYEATGNPMLVGLLSHLREQIYRYRVAYIKERENCPMLVKEHEAILRALHRRDAAAAVAAMHEHLANQASAVREIIRQQEENETA